MAAHLSEKEWVALIRAHPELASIPGRLRVDATDIRAAAADTLCHIGGRPKFMLFVIEGEIRLVRRARNGAEIVLQRAIAGFVAEGSLESLRYHCDIVAARDSRIVGFPIKDFREALHDDESFRTFWMARLAREVRKLRAQCERLSMRSAPERTRRTPARAARPASCTPSGFDCAAPHGSHNCSIQPRLTSVLSSAACSLQKIAP